VGFRCLIASRVSHTSCQVPRGVIGGGGDQGGRVGDLRRSGVRAGGRGVGGGGDPLVRVGGGKHPAVLVVGGGLDGGVCIPDGVRDGDGHGGRLLGLGDVTSAVVGVFDVRDDL